MKAHTAPIFMLLLLFPIAALAADAATPAAPAAQSAVWTSTDYLKGAFTGAIGGLISGLVALVIGWMNNKNALKINQQKIEAEEKSLEKSYAQQIAKICYEEKRKLCSELLQEINEYTLVKRIYDIRKIWHIYTQISFYCGFRYREYARCIINLATNDEILKKCATLHKKKTETDKETEDIHNQLHKYMKFYNSFVIITQKMLAGEELLPPTKWNLDDFEGSVQLDYRQSLP